MPRVQEDLSDMPEIITNDLFEAAKIVVAEYIRQELGGVEGKYRVDKLRSLLYCDYLSELGKCALALVILNKFKETTKLHSMLREELTDSQRVKEGKYAWYRLQLRASTRPTQQRIQSTHKKIEACYSSPRLTGNEPAVHSHASQTIFDQLREDYICLLRTNELQAGDYKQLLGGKHVISLKANRHIYLIFKLDTEFTDGVPMLAKIEVTKAKHSKIFAELNRIDYSAYTYAELNYQLIAQFLQQENGIICEASKPHAAVTDESISNLVKLLNSQDCSPINIATSLAQQCPELINEEANSAECKLEAIMAARLSQIHTPYAYSAWASSPAVAYTSIKTLRDIRDEIYAANQKTLPYTQFKRINSRDRKSVV